MASTGETEGLVAVDGVRNTWFEDSTCIIIVIDTFVEGDFDTV